MHLDKGVEVGTVEVQTLPVLGEADRLRARQVVEARLAALRPAEIFESPVEVETLRRRLGLGLGQAVEDELGCSLRYLFDNSRQGVYRNAHVLTSGECGEAGPRRISLRGDTRLSSPFVCTEVNLVRCCGRHESPGN